MRTEIEKDFILEAFWAIKIYGFWENVVWEGVRMKEASNLTSSD